MENWSLAQTSAPSIEPLTTADAKHHARVDAGADDAYVAQLVKVARRYVERITGRQLITATYELRMDRFYEVILLPRPPVQSVTSVKYIDTEGNSATVSSDEYDTDLKSEPARITEAWGEVWPATRSVVNAVTVTYDAGYGDNASDVPGDLIHAMKLLVGHWYEYREQTIAGAVSRQIPVGVEALCRNYSVTNYGSVYPGVD